MRQFERVACAAALVGICLYGAGALTSADAAGLYPTDAAIVVASVAIAGFALGVAFYTTVRLHRQAADFTRFSRSVEITLSRLTVRSEAQGEIIERMQHSFDERLGEIMRRERGNPAADEEQASNVVPHPSSTRVMRKAAARGATAQGSIENAVSGNGPELSLQPIISVAGNAAVGFETFIHLELEDGTGEDVYRLAPGEHVFSQAVLERQLIARAAEASRRRLGARGGLMPLHCPISEALLDDADACGEVVELLSGYPALTRSIVLSLPEKLLRDGTPTRRQSLAELLECGVAFAVEGWEGPQDGLQGLRDRGVLYLKMDAGRLLGRSEAPSDSLSGADIVTGAAQCGVQTIACGIESDEDAVDLLDLGIDLMVGNRFSEPQRLQSAGDGAGRVA